MTKNYLILTFLFLSISLFAVKLQANSLYLSHNNVKENFNFIKNEKPNIPSIMVFPNTAFSEIYIEWVDQIFNIEIFNLQGKVISSFSNQVANATIPIKNFAKGTYILKIYDLTCKESKVVKFLKN